MIPGIFIPKLKEFYISLVARCSQKFLLDSDSSLVTKLNSHTDEETCLRMTYHLCQSIHSVLHVRRRYQRHDARVHHASSAHRTRGTGHPQQHRPRNCPPCKCTKDETGYPKFSRTNSAMSASLDTSASGKSSTGLYSRNASACATSRAYLTASIISSISRGLLRNLESASGASNGSVDARRTVPREKGCIRLSTKVPPDQRISSTACSADTTPSASKWRSFWYPSMKLWGESFGRYALGSCVRAARAMDAALVEKFCMGRKPRKSAVAVVYGPVFVDL